VLRSHKQSAPVSRGILEWSSPCCGTERHDPCLPSCVSRPPAGLAPALGLAAALPPQYSPECTDGWSRTRDLRILFRGFSRSLCVVSISRSSGLKSDFSPLCEPSLSGLDIPVLLRCTIICFASPLPYQGLRPRWHAIEQDLFQRPDVVGQSGRHRRCARPPYLR
jgi:hypothetical protein